jgi:predicted HTH transcriptional regulator
MSNLDDILRKLKNCLENKTYEPMETDSFELKDLSTKGKWDELYKSACAFLNTQGGIIIVGIHENLNWPKSYQLTGYNDNNESKLISLTQQFSDCRDRSSRPQNLDLKEFFTWEIHEFLDKRICIIKVRALPEDQKYVCWQKIAYERAITGDHQIGEDRINAQLEQREEWRRARELLPVLNATLEDLDLDKLNEYIQSLNQSTRIETLKSELQSAIPFLTRKFFIDKEQKPTLLGMLVCGKYVDDFIGGRCQVDAYVQVDSAIALARNKKIFKNNILKLMDDSYDFCLQNIQIGVSYAQGGSKLPEYPLKLIRETLNNALAHRDYRSDQFTIITIKPNRSLEIQNPGNFRQQILITINQTQNNDQHKLKIRAIIPEPKPSNPKLAEILKVYDKWEGRGIGMASLTNACLNNEIDVPYYKLGLETVSLVIPSGKVYDESEEYWLDSFSGYLKRKYDGYEPTTEEKIVLSYFFKTEKLNRLECYTILLTQSNNHFKVIAKLEDKGLIYKHPESPSPYAVYLVDRELVKSEFTSELKRIFGQDYDYLSKDYKDVLNVIYHLNNYSSKEFASANLVAKIIYLRHYKTVINIENYESFKRKIRTIFKKLENSSLIVRPDQNKRMFYLNKNFQRSPLF